jgi:proteasome assembly chaperone (PAC2) family protein
LPTNFLKIESARLVDIIARRRCRLEPGASPHLRVHKRVELRSPALIVALAGWSDAAEVATQAARFLVRAWDAEPVAEIDPEEFYVFTELRPHVRIAEGAQRKIDWPGNEFFAHRARDDGRDCLIFIGHEPHLKWRTYVQAMMSQAEAVGTSLVVCLGGLLADVPHSRAPKLTGSATDPLLAERLGRLNVRSSRYEGPTSLLSVLNQACRGRKLSAASIWGNVPHYIQHSQNPAVTAAILRRLDNLLDLGLDLRELDESATSFESQVAEAISRDLEAQAYVRKLEQREDQGEDEEPDMPVLGQGDLPSGEEVVRQLEEFLKRRSSEDE